MTGSTPNLKLPLHTSIVRRERGTPSSSVNDYFFRNLHLPDSGWRQEPCAVVSVPMIFPLVSKQTSRIG